MEEARQLYKAGKLRDAISAMTEEVRKNPTDHARRGFLSELLCIAGDVDRADKQLQAVTAQQPSVAVGVSLVRQLIRAERHRRDFFEQGRVPEVIEPPSESMRLQLEASILLRQGQAEAASEKLARAEELRPRVRGTRGGALFEDFRDLDDLVGGHFEVLTSTGKYYWIPIARVESYEPRPPENALDLNWLPVEMDVRGGPEGLVYLPTVYTGATPVEEDEFLLGRATDWKELPGGAVLGRGQRCFLVGEEDVNALALGSVMFEVAE